MPSSPKSDPFDDLHQQIEASRKELQANKADIERLKHTKLALGDDVKSLTKDVTKLVSQKDELETEISNRLFDIEEKEKASAKKINNGEVIFNDSRRAFTNEVNRKNAELNDREQLIIQRGSQVEDSEKELKKKHVEADEALAMHKRATENLQERENDVTSKETEAITRSNELDAREEALKTLEVMITENEKKVAEMVQTAETTKKSAGILLSQAKEQIAIADAKANENTNRADMLNLKEAELTKREVAIRDREGILASR